MEINGKPHEAGAVQQVGTSAMKNAPTVKGTPAGGFAAPALGRAERPAMTMDGIQLHQCECTELLPGMPDGSVDIVMTDPPYMYLGHRLDRPFDLAEVYGQCARILRPERGAMAVFGRGPSFYRTGALLESIGLRFLEEVVWLKSRRSSPVTALGRVHETVSIWGLGRAGINRVRVPIVEKCAHDPQRIAAQIDRIAKACGNPGHLEALRRYFEDGSIALTGTSLRKPDSLSLRSGIANHDRRVASARILVEGGAEESAIRAEDDDFYNRLHPTQKPVALLKRLLALIMPPDKKTSDITVLDPFGGSFSTMAAAWEMGMRGISCEIDPVYFERGAKRIAALAAGGRQAAMDIPAGSIEEQGNGQ